MGQFIIENQNYLQDLKLNVSYEDNNNLIQVLKTGTFKIMASRARFQHFALKNSTVRNKAMDGVKDAMNEVYFADQSFHHPIPYTVMYVQWEANKVVNM